MNSGGQNLWKIIAMYAMSKILHQMGKLHTNGVLKNKSEATHTSDIFLDYVPCAWGSWKGDFLVADVEALQKDDASEVQGN